MQVYECEFCNKLTSYTTGNSFHGHYCEECLRISIAEDKECLKKIKEQKRLNK